MEGNKIYRHESNPKEKELHDKFIAMLNRSEMGDNLSAIIFGWQNDRQNIPKKWLTEYEESICLNLIQWLGSPVGQGFLRSCGFELKDN